MQLTTVARLDPHPLHLGRFGRHLGAEHAGGDDAIDATDPFDSFDGEAEHGERVGQRGEVVSGVDVVAEPGEEDLHQNCSAKRMSPVNISRMSPTA